MNKTLREMGRKGSGYGYGTSAKALSRALELQARALRAVRLPGMASAPRAALSPWTVDRDEDLDQNTKLKLEALEAIGSSKEDSASFQTLKEIVLNRSAHPRLRTEAMEQLVDFKKYDPLPVFLEVAKSDTGSEIQNAAIDYIGMLTKDKNRSVETLIELFYAIPADHSEQRENIFYSIAEVGNDRAVDFLAKIAKTDQKYDLRSQAIYYLGSIGNDRAKSALYEILREK
jgi:HEAT repeat protein